jgi:hypothetical protein
MATRDPPILRARRKFVAACLGIIVGFFVVLLTEAIRHFLVNAYRYALRVEAYVGLLTDRYPPFSLAA